ncbi:MAG: hypothetical protein Q8O99_08320 [bacterium]|nr:hypothetical protein [bacterium]
MVNLQQSLRRYIPKVNIARGNILKHHYHFGCQLFFRIHQELLMKLLGRKFSKKEVVTRIEGHTFLIYDTIVSYLVLDEIRTQQLYRKFRGCKKILDVGGYLGESAVYFNQIC